MPPTSSHVRFIHFAGPIADPDRIQIERLLHQAEQIEDFVPVPTLAGSPWVVSVFETGSVAISRLGTRLMFAAPSTEAIIDRLDRWIATIRNERILEPAR